MNDKIKEQDSWIFEKISIASGLAQSVYTIYLSASIYSMLTIFTVTDFQLVINDKVKLPIINSDIPVVGFFFLTPIFLIVLYCYFQVYHFHVDDLIKKSKMLGVADYEYKYYPWIINMNRSLKSGFLGFMQATIFKLIMWWLLPITLTLFSLAFAKKHDIIISYFIGLLPIVGSLITLYFWSKYDLYDYKKKSLRYIGYGLNKGIVFIIINYGKFLLVVINVLYLSVYFFELLPAIQKGITYEPLSRIAFVELENVIFNDGTRRARFDNINLSGAIMNNVTIKNSDLTNISFSGAKISGCNFENSEINQCDFKNAFLYNNNFRKTSFVAVVFDSTRFTPFNFGNNGFVFYDNDDGIDSKNILTNAMFYKTKIDHSVFNGVILDSALVNGMVIKNTVFRGSSLNNTIFSDFIGDIYYPLVLSDSEFNKCYMRSVLFQTYGKGSMKNIKYIYSDLSEFSFFNIVVDNALFLGNILKNGRLEKVELRDISFYDKNRPLHTFERHEDKDIALFIELYNRRDYIKENMKQLNGLKSIDASYIDSVSAFEIRKYSPALLRK